MKEQIIISAIIATAISIVILNWQSIADQISYIIWCIKERLKERKDKRSNTGAEDSDDERSN